VNFSANFRRMKTRLLSSLLLLLAAPALVRATDRDIRRVFPVRPGCTLQLETYRGQITIEEGDAAEVRVWLHLEIGADTDAEAGKIAARLQLGLEAHDNTVAITARNPRATGVHFDWEEEKQIDLTYRISVPRRCSLELGGTNTSATIGNLTGRMSAHVENGTLFFRRVDGAVTASTDNGDIVISRCTGAVDARVSRGLIRLGPVGGRAVLKNSMGNIEVMSARGGIEARAEAGDISVGFPRALRGDAQLTTSGGNIFVRLDPGAGCVVDAKSVWGCVDCKPSLVVIEGASGSRRLVGRFNGAGPVLMLRASGGSVKIDGGDVWFE